MLKKTSKKKRIMKTKNKNVQEVANNAQSPSIKRNPTIKTETTKR
jgi:hypothetical protein